MIRMSYTKIKETMSNVGGAIALTAMIGGAVLGGIRACNERPKYERATYQGYNVTVNDDKVFREMFLSCPDNTAGEQPFSAPCIEAMDYGPDGRFDIIELRGVPKGHPLEEYANLEKLQDVYQAAVKANAKRNH